MKAQSELSIAFLVTVFMKISGKKFQFFFPIDIFNFLILTIVIYFVSDKSQVSYFVMEK